MEATKKTKACVLLKQYNNHNYILTDYFGIIKVFLNFDFFELLYISVYSYKSTSFEYKKKKKQKNILYNL